MPVSNTLRGLLLVLALISASFPVAAQSRIAFVSSATGNGDFSSWPQAGEGLAGLEAADSVCIAQATAAGLANPQNFKAWLSDSTDDAYCRVHGLGGKKASDCGEASLPVAAGPWMRTDGLPWAGTIDQVINLSAVYMPALIDESGAAVPIDRTAWLATGANGEAQGSSCSDWTDDIAGTGGSLPLQTTGWYNNGGTFCSADDVHLLCLETGTGQALELQEPDGNIAFITSASGSGDLSSWLHATSGTSGIEAGDSICNTLAAAANLPFQGRYKAWLSDDSADDSVDARDRFEHDGPWDRLDGLRVATSLAELTDGVLDTASHMTETGGYAGNHGIWTGTRADGTGDTANCGSWQSADSIGRVGRSNHSTEGWTDYENANCFNTFYHLQCLSDVDLSPKRVFATSAKGTADLGGWPQAGESLTGTAAADSICVSLASSATLDNPQNFVAWISDASDDAYCRIHNLTGKVSNNCGQSELPLAAGPWTRTDGVPAWSSVAELLTSPNAFFSPILKDETGAEVNRSEGAWSATENNGVAQSSSFTCGDWTIDNAGAGRILPLQFNGWSSISNSPCSTNSGHLVCVETGQALNLAPLPLAGNIIFLSSATGNGELGSWAEAESGTTGIEAGDSICNHLAEQANLPFQGNYKAWLSDASVSARERFTQRGTWQRPDGIQIAEDLDDLTDGGLFAGLVQTEQGEYLGSFDVWTGTLANGEASGLNCGNWDSSSAKDSGVTGVSSYTTSSWTAFTTRDCSQQGFTHLYCLSDVELVYLFEDGFESPSFESPGPP